MTRPEKLEPFAGGAAVFTASQPGGLDPPPFVHIAAMFYTLSTLLEILLAERADGLHLHPGEKPVVEVARNLFQVSGPAIEPGDIAMLLRQIATKEEFREFQSSRIVSCYYQVPGKGWFNVMAFREQGQIRLEIRSVR